MKSFLFPAHNNRVTVVGIGSLFHIPTSKDMAEIQKWIKDHENLWPNCAKEIPNLFGYDIKVEPWPAILNGKKCIWVVEIPENFQTMTGEDKEFYQSCFNNAQADDDVLFTWGAVSIKRIGETLKAFL